jgi:hypothetical protein
MLLGLEDVEQSDESDAAKTDGSSPSPSPLLLPTINSSPEYLGSFLRTFSSDTQRFGEIFNIEPVFNGKKSTDPDLSAAAVLIPSAVIEAYLALSCMKSPW